MSDTFKEKSITISHAEKTPITVTFKEKEIVTVNFNTIDKVVKTELAEIPTLGELADANVSGLETSHIVKYDKSLNKWVNIAFSTFLENFVDGSQVIMSGGKIGLNQALIDHNQLTNYTETKHRIINDSSVSLIELWSAYKISSELANKSDVGHVHTESEISDLDKYGRSYLDAALAAKASSTHTHPESAITDLDKYTQAEVNSLLSSKSDTDHVHTESQITDLDKYTKAEIAALLATKAALSHAHDDLYYTETELDNGVLNFLYYTETEIDALLAAYSLITHDHDTHYYTIAQVDGFFTAHLVAYNHALIHTHLNQILLDSYTQTEVNLADAVSKKHTQNTDTATNSNRFHIGDGTNDADKEIIANDANPGDTQPTIRYHVATQTWQYSNNGVLYVNLGSGGSGGASALSDLTDVDLSGLADTNLIAYDEATGLWKPVAYPTSAEWGNITGTLSNQTDLNLILSGKTDVGHSHVESDITDLGSYILVSQKGVNNGVAELDAGGKVPIAQLPSTIMEYKGTWNANTNVPILVDGTGDNGDVYLCSVSGTQNLGSGSQTFSEGDWIVYNGSIWQKSINSNAVVSVNGQQGVVSLSTDNISDFTNKRYVSDNDLINLSNLSGTNTGDQSASDFNHNDLSSLQGGTTNEYYHLTSSEYTELSTWLADVILSDGGSLDIGTGNFITEGSFYFGDGTPVGSFQISDKYVMCKVFTSAGINSAIDALGSEGGTVYLPEGTYVVDSPIVIDYSNTQLIGSGFGTYLDASAWTATGQIIYAASVINCRIADLKINGSKNASYDTIYFTTAQNVRIENVYIDNGNSYGIRLDGGSNCKYNIIENCRIEDCYIAGIMIYGSYVNIVNNFINDFSAISTCRGVELYYSSFVYLFNNTITTAKLPIYSRGSSNLQIISNAISNTSAFAADYVVWITGDSQVSTKNLIKGNQISSGDAGKTVLYLHKVSNSTVEGNIFNGGTGANRGIYLNDVTTTSNFIINNLFSSCATAIETHSSVNTVNYVRDNNYVTVTTRLTDAGGAIKLIEFDANNYYAFSVDTLLNVANKVQFRDSAIYINSIDDGHLDLTADISIDLNGNVQITGSNQLRFWDTGVYIAANDDGHLDITADVIIDFNSPAMFATTNQLRFRDAAIHVSSIDDGHLDLTADTSIDINALLNCGSNNIQTTGSLTDGSVSVTIAKIAKVYSASFTSSNLTVGVLTVTHNLGIKYTGYFIYDNTDKLILPDDATATDTNTLTINLTSYGTITGTWNIKVVA